AINRFWPVPGLFELAIYGDSSAPDDPLRYRSMFRSIDVADGGGTAPWGWNANACGVFEVPTAPDPLGIDTIFGSLRSSPDDPEAGKRASVWGLELALRRGIDGLAAHGLVRSADSRIAISDDAFAYLVTMNIVEKVWTEVVGFPLTIANYFPRSEVQRD